MTKKEKKLFDAIKNNDYKTVGHLLGSRVNFEVVDESGKTIIEIAREKKSFLIIYWLYLNKSFELTVDELIFVKFAEYLGFIFHKNLRRLQEIFCKGFDMEPLNEEIYELFYNIEERNFIHLAAEKNDVDMFKLCEQFSDYQYEGSFNHTDRFEKTALDIAIENKSKEAIEYLKSIGAMASKDLEDSFNP